VLAAHNARFDYGFLKNEFRRSGVRYLAPVLCTVKLSRRLYPHHRRHNLDALIIRHALFCADRHRALGDARLLWELAQIWRRELPADTLDTVCAELLRRPTVPEGLPADVFDQLPEAPGAYVFYGEDDRALYVGESINIRSRVMNHFAGGALAGKDLRIAAEVKRVDWIETAGELGAQMKEAQLLKALTPVYNRKGRGPAELCAWRWRPDTPEAAPELVSASALGADMPTDLFGLFRSRASARETLRGLAAAHGLCHVLLGLEQRNEEGPCSAHALGRCRGACVGKEKPIAHAMRLAQALAGLRMRPWPYAGRIGVRERDPERDRSELYVFDRWRYLGTAKSEAELYELAESMQSAAFDLDTYRILARFLKSPPSTCEIVPI